MTSALRPLLQAAAQFLRTPTLGRRVAGLLAVAIVLLLLVNLAVFVMIRRTATFNDAVETGYSVRLAASEVLTLMVDAETGQRGYLLTGEPVYLEPYNASLSDLPDRLDELAALAAEDNDLAARVDLLRELTTQRLDVIDRSLTLARMGRMDAAADVLREGTGKQVMDRLRAEVAAIDEVQATRMMFGTRRTEWAATVTVIVNALAAVLILILGGVSAWMIRRYVVEIQEARDALDRLNAGLEHQVRDRTFELTRANEEIQRFAYIVSHDLRAPLVNVMGYTAELEQAGRIIDRQMTAVETKAPKLVEQDALTAVRDDVPEAIGFIRASTEKMDRLINAILKLSREGRRHLTPEPLDMTGMVRGIADSLNHQTQRADAEIVVGDLPAMESDRLSVEQVFGNLLDNAVKYLERGRPGRIVVSGRDLGNGWVTYQIEDNGRGVPERDHERIFELFRRSGRQDRDGEGLGLAFVRNSVRRLGGDISLESELGKGSTFTVKFPTRLVLADAGDHL